VEGRRRRGRDGMWMGAEKSTVGDKGDELRPVPVVAAQRSSTGDVWGEEQRRIRKSQGGTGRRWFRAVREREAGGVREAPWMGSGNWNRKKIVGG